MNEQELIEKWVSVFGEGVDPNLIDERVTAEHNYLWHLFTWGHVSCLEDDVAREAFDNLEYTEAIKFCGGYSSHIEDIAVVGKLSAEEIDNASCGDIYITAKDFSWTYVRTHETIQCGPYLCVKSK